jgi:hypothetical protein
MRRVKAAARDPWAPPAGGTSQTSASEETPTADISAGLTNLGSSPTSPVAGLGATRSRRITGATG